MTSIFIYHDYVHHNAPLWFALTRRYKNVRYVDANDVIGGVLDEKPRAFIMPGGASRYSAAKLAGTGNAAIKNYVTDGGRYIGICGGAYYACSHITWQHGTQHFDVSYDLGISGAVAKGPIDIFCTADNTARLTTLTTASGLTPIFYMGGPQFTHVPSDARVLATYSSLPADNAAIIQGACGKGRYLLSSPHPEYDHAALELMRFDVPDNKYADIAALPDTSALTLDYFYQILDSFLEP